MKKLLLTLLTLGLLTNTSWAIPYSSSLSFDLSGADANGVGSIHMDLTIKQVYTSATDFYYQLTAVLENTSPLETLSNPALLNIPGVVGFGFNFASPKPAMNSWDLQAQQYLSNTLTTVDLESSGIWKISNIPYDQTTKVDGFVLDMAVVNTLDGSHNALYNSELVYLDPIPDALNADKTGKKTPYFTTATLTLNFNNVQAIPVEVYVRMQRVGDNQEGSLKLTGLFNGWATGNPVLVPEPATFVLLSVGLVGLGLLSRKRAKNN
ncbi:PEP-CTERM sorting domain-containing protein [Trichloromonas sp.]|uniref:PEP-CTERM sorting domain-containing protein n=1 Tax=Trichloromonas sp. TaxID=3069249 RepID=UPI003D815B8C